MSEDRTKLPRGYFIDEAAQADDEDCLMSDYVEDYVDRAMGETDTEELIRLAWEDYDELSPEVLARLDE